MTPPTAPPSSTPDVVIAGLRKARSEMLDGDGWAPAIDAALTLIADLARDAGRYRWLREKIAAGSDGNDGNWTALVEITDGYSNSDMYDDGKELDAALDSAMSASTAREEA